MKYLVLLTASLLMLGSTGMALAQYDSLVAQTPSATIAPAFTGNPKVKEIVDRIKLQRARIDAAMADGKLLADPGAELKKKLLAIRLELQTDFSQNKKNGREGLTDDQIKQLNAELNENLTAIRKAKHENVTNP